MFWSMMMVCLLAAVLVGCPKPDPRPMGAPDPLACPDGTTEVLSGVLEHWCERPDGTKHGPWQRWHLSGERAEHVLYDEGRREGAYWKWRDDGVLELEGMYQRGLKNGDWVWWYEPERPKIVGFFQSGFENGEWTSYYATGRVQSQGSYQGGEKRGAWRYLHPNGFDAATGTYTELGEKADDWQYFDADGEPLTAEQFARQYPIYDL